MTKLQKIGLSVSIVAAILWTIWLFAWWNYNFSSCDPYVYLCISEASYNLIHFILIVLFVVWIGMILSEISRKSLKKSCIMLMVSWLLGNLAIGFSLWLLDSLCAWDCMEVEVPWHVFWMFWVMCVVLWFIVLFFTMRHLTHSNKRGILTVLIVIGLLGTFLLQANTGCEYLLRCVRSSFNVMFWVFLIVSIMLCVIGWIKSYKESKKSS